MVGDDIDEQK
ncbi:hypothetical protein YPPY63_2430, partial [Yersinia pestis PY-63]